jgi:hypothetical protein
MLHHLPPSGRAQKFPEDASFRIAMEEPICSPVVPRFLDGSLMNHSGPDLQHIVGFRPNSRGADGKPTVLLTGAPE